MPSYKKILFPTDLSEASSKIAPHVKEIADRFDAQVNLVYVAHVNNYYAHVEIPTSYVVDFEAVVIKGAEKQLQEFATVNFKDRTVQAKVISGHPGEEILDYALSERIDLIIMGHSTKGLKRMIMGSVAGRVVKSSPVPVLIVNPDATTANDGTD